MIDYFFKWTNEAAAKADALALAQFLNVNVVNVDVDWLRDKVIPNVKAWRPSQDVVTGSGTILDPFITTHTYLSGWFAIAAWPNQVAILLNATALQFALNRDGPPYIVKNNIGGIITDVACSPIFAGSHYPLGGYT